MHYSLSNTQSFSPSKESGNNSLAVSDRVWMRLSPSGSRKNGDGRGLGFSLPWRARVLSVSHILMIISLRCDTHFSLDHFNSGFRRFFTIKACKARMLAFQLCPRAPRFCEDNGKVFFCEIRPFHTRCSSQCTERPGGHGLWLFFAQYINVYHFNTAWPWSWEITVTDSLSVLALVWGQNSKSTCRRLSISLREKYTLFMESKHVKPRSVTPSWFLPPRYHFVPCMQYVGPIFPRWFLILPLFLSSLPGLLSWDLSSCHVDLEKELKVVTEAAPPGEELRAGDKHVCLLLMNFGRVSSWITRIHK